MATLGVHPTGGLAFCLLKSKKHFLNSRWKDVSNLEEESHACSFSARTTTIWMEIAVWDDFPLRGLSTLLRAWASVGSVPRVGRKSIKPYKIPAAPPDASARPVEAERAYVRHEREASRKAARTGPRLTDRYSYAPACTLLAQAHAGDAAIYK
ncbi:hypothetical protein EVAR_879_1 [Eumeta japonica]|uniref:Uncharacterized protein n=1 Tax=Eumeta variegata TaxID=151549 RepID=A0A4C1SDM3_EUMVA|nr:hypothetical protein EVAR_879_1 [Eumeta japonica]